MISRMERGLVAEWCWTVDFYLLGFSILLLICGLCFSFSASPSVALHIGKQDSYFFVKQHFLFSGIAFIILLFFSFFNYKQICHFVILLLGLTALLMIATLLYGTPIKGAQRWISFCGFALQPSEFMKPAFVIVSSLLLAKKGKEAVSPFYLWFSLFLYVFFAALLVLEPDIGQTVLLSGIWLILLFLCGVSYPFLGCLGSFFIIALYFAYSFIPHVHNRIESFFTGHGNTFQVDMGREAIMHGGWFGLGPGEGTIKCLIPDSHTDFIFSVVAEEYGIGVCVLIVLIFLTLFLRSLYLAYQEHFFAKSLMISGLASLISLQFMVNIGVNLHMIPAKGMTLPFISYGGSSMVSTAMSMGILLALTRHKPYARWSYRFFASAFSGSSLSKERG